ncbi:hypothetical protein QZH41_003934 [Actinostola sp. cb2023]|nr:hypothetical protein QZH41_003934 [Actinostola sp. cb2023]
MENTDTDTDDGVLQHFVDTLHAGSVLSRLQELRTRKELCDVTLVVEGREIVVHRAVLAATSRYFNALFTSPMSEKSMKIVEIKEVDPEALEVLINFAYTSRLTITDTNVQNLFIASDRLEFKSAKDACIDFIMRQIEISNCLRILALAERHGLKVLKAAANNCITNNFIEVVETEDFKNLNSSQVLELLCKDDIKVSSEKQVFKACVTWIKHDIHSRRQFMSELLKVVRLPFVPLKDLHDEVAKHPLVATNVYCQDIVEDAEAHHCERAGIRMRNSYAEALYVLGGETSFMKEEKSVERLNTEKNEWENTKDMSEARASFAVVSYKNKLYVIGGYRRGRKLKIMECYDPIDNSWSSLPSTTKCQGDMRAAVLGDYIYVAGGSSDRLLTCNYVERYSPSTGRWETVATMHRQRRRFALAVLNLCMYAVGGFDDTTGDLSHMEHYKPDTNSWYEDPEMLSCRYDFGAVALSGYLYAVGGANGRRGSLNTVERYDPVNNVWSQVAPLRQCRGGVSVAVNCGKIFVVNGMNEYMSIVNTVECYNEVKNKWISVASTRTARFSAAAVVFPPVVF